MEHSGVRVGWHPSPRSIPTDRMVEMIAYAPVSAGPSTAIFPWQVAIFAAPLFALGLLLPPDRWASLLFRDMRVTIIAYVSLAAYAVGMMFSPAFQDWFVAGCHNRYEQCEGTYWPLEVVGQGITLVNLMVYTKIFLQRLFTIFVVLCVVGSWVRPLRRFAPCFAEFLMGVGRRTLYVYLLHWVLFIVPSSRTSFRDLVKEFIIAWNLNVDVVEALVGLVATLALGCRLTEVLFCWMTQLPIWIVSAVTSRLRENSKDSQALCSGKAATSTSDISNLAGA